MADPRVTLLRTIPGVGIRTAEAVVAWIDRPARFKSSKAVASYFGLVPCEDSSAGIQRLGHISKQGPSLVRRLIAEAAWRAIRRSPTMRVYFERITQGNPDRSKIAAVATGHYLLRCMYAMLRGNTPGKNGWHNPWRSRHPGRGIAHDGPRGGAWRSATPYDRTGAVP